MFFSQILVHFFFFNDTATTEIYTLSLHDALPIYGGRHFVAPAQDTNSSNIITQPDRKSTRLNSSHVSISYAVFCLKKKKQIKGTADISEKTKTNSNQNKMRRSM